MFCVSVTERQARLLPLDYAPQVPPEMLHELEQVGRRIGMSLYELEMLGQDASAIEKFLYDRQHRGHEAAVANAPWPVLEAQMGQRRTID